MRNFLVVALSLAMAGAAVAQVTAPTVVIGAPLISATAVKAGFNARLHMQQFATSASPTVCLVGDSTSSYTANQIEQSELMARILEARIQSDNPTKTINFVNRAVPSQTWATLNGTAVSNYPSWYIYTNLPWMPYIQSQNCSTIFVNMGINDSAGISPFQIRSVLAKFVGFGTQPPSWSATAKTVGTVIVDSNGRLQEVYAAGTPGTSAPVWATAYPGASTTDGGVTWILLNTIAYVPKVPDIILITNKIQNPLSFPSSSGALLAAAYQRNLARSGGAFLNIPNLPPIGLIDLGLYQASLLLGVDPDNQYLSADTINYPSGTNVPFVAVTKNSVSGYGYSWPTTPFGDFGMTGTFYGRGTDMLTTGGSLWLIGLGTNTTNYIQISQSGANLTATITDGSGGYQGCTGIVAANASGNIVWSVTAKGSRVLLTINGATICNGDYPRLQGSFAPWMQVTGSPVGSAIIATMTDYAQGVPMPLASTLGGAAAYGSAVSGTGSPQTGGNGNNHSSSMGIAAEDAAFLRQLNFSTQ